MINNINKHLAKMTKREKEDSNYYNQGWRGDVTIELTETKRGWRLSPTSMTSDLVNHASIKILAEKGERARGPANTPECGGGTASGEGTENPPPRVCPACVSHLAVLSCVLL